MPAALTQATLTAADVAALTTAFCKWLPSVKPSEVALASCRCSHTEDACGADVMPMPDSLEAFLRYQRSHGAVSGDSTASTNPADNSGAVSQLMHAIHGLSLDEDIIRRLLNHCGCCTFTSLHDLEARGSMNDAMSLVNGLQNLRTSSGEPLLDLPLVTVDGVGRVVPCLSATGVKPIPRSLVLSGKAIALTCAAHQGA